MKTGSYGSFSDISGSISTDSLEIPRDSSTKYIQESLSKITPKESKQSSTQVNMKRAREKVPIRKRNNLVQKASNCENVNTNKVNQETNTIKPVYPEIIIKHCHNNKVTEKVIPAVDGKLRNTKPKSHLEVIRFGEKNGKLNVFPNGRNTRSYLEIFQSRNGMKIGAKTEPAKSAFGDNTPRDFCNLDLRNHIPSLEDDSSFYLKHLEDVERKRSEIRYPSQASILTECSTASNNSPDCISKSSSLVHTSSGLTSISEQMLAIREVTPSTPKIMTPTICKKNGLRRLTKCESNPTKEKLEKYIRQREYGQTVSNINRIKIIQSNIRNSEIKPTILPSKNSITKPVDDKKLVQKRKVIKNCDNKVQMIDTGTNPEEQPSLKLEEIHINDKFGRKKKTDSILSHGALSSLHNRHLKEQEIVEKLRNISL